MEHVAAKVVPATGGKSCKRRKWPCAFSMGLKSIWFAGETTVTPFPDSVLLLLPVHLTTPTPTMAAFPVTKVLPRGLINRGEMSAMVGTLRETGRESSSRNRRPAARSSFPQILTQHPCGANFYDCFAV